MSRAITSVAVGDRYRPYGERLRESLKVFLAGAEFRMHTEWPPGSPTHSNRHYSFKWWAVKYAIDQGARYVMWLDAACQVIADLEPIWQEIQKRGVYIVHGDHILGEWISDQALAHFGMSRDQAMKLPLCGGAIVGLDMERIKAKKFYEQWGQIAASPLMMCSHSKHDPKAMKSVIMSDGPKEIVYSTDARVKGHRSDESCFSVMVKQMGIETVWVRDWNRVIRSGYDL